MRYTVAALLIAMSSPAPAQQEAMDAGKAMAEQMGPYQECLKTEVAKASSKEEAQKIVQEACTDIRAGLKSKVIEAIKHMVPPSPPYDPDEAADKAFQMVQVYVYFDYTGQLRAFREKMKKNAEERKAR